MAEDVITMYTDGSARGNPGPGGYGAILIYKGHRKEISGGFLRTTNNRMELKAVIEGLKLLTKKSIPISIYSDSQYVVRAINDGWLENWIRTNFKGGKKNADLWREFYEISQDFNVKISWVKGHADNALNNRCDQLATAAADQKNLAVDVGYEG